MTKKETKMTEKTNETVENSTALLTLTVQRDAKLKYFAGYGITEISRMLGVPATTVASWKKREKWDEADVFERISGSLETRYCQLMQKEVKSSHLTIQAQAQHSNALKQAMLLSS